MKIARIEIANLDIPFKKPFVVAIGRKTHARNVVVKICTDEGLVGWGEASPSPYITGDTQAGCMAAARELAGLLVGKDPCATENRMRELNGHIAHEPSARSAFDMALYDIAAQAAGMPLYRFLGGESREIRTDFTIGLEPSVEESLREAEHILASGYDAIKMKVGRADMADLPHVRAVHKLAQGHASIKVDANQGWDYPSAVANLKAMADLGLRYVEQPLKHWDHEGLAQLRGKVDIPLCADESVFDDKDALSLVRAKAADYLNIKLGKAGGMHTALKINAIAEAAGMKCMIGGFAESRLGVTAAAHFAVARPNVAFIDLSSPLLLAGDPIEEGATFCKAVGGVIKLPETPGLGVSVDLKERDFHIIAA